eukprot:9501736-Pyramimonas_sp.AAC.1
MLRFRRCRSVGSAWAAAGNMVRTMAMIRLRRIHAESKSRGRAVQTHMMMVMLIMMMIMLRVMMMLGMIKCSSMEPRLSWIEQRRETIQL